MTFSEFAQGIQILATMQEIMRAELRTLQQHAESYFWVRGAAIQNVDPMEGRSGSVVIAVGYCPTTQSPLLGQGRAPS